MAGQLLTTYGLGFRLLRKLKAPSVATDLVVYDNRSATTEDVNIYGIVDHNTQGYCHIEFSVPSADCVVRTLDSSAVNQQNSCGMLYFVYKDREQNKQKISIIITEFVQESDGANYNFYINGRSQPEILPPLK